MLKMLLPVCRLIDGLNERIGRTVYWLVLVAVLISAGNAIVRYGLNTSSNAWLEVQWYIFSAIFLLCSGYTLLRNEHIRIDIVINGLSKRKQIWIDVIGGLLFLIPMCVTIIYLSWPMVLDSYVRQEMSTDAGGLIRWPVKLLIPVGFSLLLLQGISETIKRIAFLAGLIEDPTEKPEVAVTHAAVGER
jgi:TRAP-type mannitol/chloroaromatic compound transport system permease small subunit